MNKHEHLECAHILKFCPRCDTVYCEACSVEWTRPHAWLNQQPFAGGFQGGDLGGFQGGVRPNFSAQQAHNHVR